MSYSQVSHVGHESYPPPLSPGEYPPPPPPRPGFEQGYGGPPPQAPYGGPGYQAYLSDNYPPPPTNIYHSGTNRPYQNQPYNYNNYDNNYSYDNACSSLLRGCLAALCCCCAMEQCCRFW